MSNPKKVFLTLWLGQLVSAVGTDLSGFALGVFVYRHTGSITEFALVAVFTRIPAILLSPFAGALADRWDRRHVMLSCNALSGLVVVALAVLQHTGQLQLWHIYAGVTVIAVSGAFRDPAYYASVGQLVPKDQMGRASGLVQVGENFSMVAPPLVAGVLVVTIGLAGVLTVDFATYAFGFLTVLTVVTPPVRQVADDAGARSLWQDTVAGWRYVLEYRGLLYLFLVGAATSFGVGMTQIAITPLVLGFGSAAVLGAIFSVGGLAMLLGGAVMAAWGGPQRKVTGVVVFGVAQSIGLLVISLRPNAYVVGAGIFMLLFSIQFVRGCTNAIILTHVPAAMQARVVALNRFVAWSTLPLSYLLAGPLVKALSPLLTPSGALAGSVGRLIGTGHNRGIALLLLALGAWYLVIVLTSYANPRLRNVEAEMSTQEQEQVTV
ncbi:MAG TPA: MFS transporter [Streptosporangiaceae bacterium]|nr:MFS transporter [Streptosporangiaceae bacterium]